MNNLNLPPFYVGQRVEYIGNGSKLKKHSKHTVLDIWKEPCGCWGIDIGKSKDSGKMLRKCIYCNVIYDNTFKAGFYARVFRPVQEAKPPLMTFTQIKEKEKEEILILN